MPSRLIVLVLLFTTLASATRVVINNYCPKELLITETVNNYDIGCKFLSVEENPLCKLKSGFYCYKDYTEGVWVTFQNGYAYNTSYAHIGIRACRGSDPNDGYLLGTSNGFDLPLQVSSSNGGPIYTCMDPNCPDSYNNDPSKVFYPKSGGVITINYCPYNTEAFATNELKLIETIQKPLAINPKHKPAIGKKKA